MTMPISARASRIALPALRASSTASSSRWAASLSASERGMCARSPGGRARQADSAAVAAATASSTSPGPARATSASTVSVAGSITDSRSLRAHPSSVGGALERPSASAIVSLGMLGDVRQRDFAVDLVDRSYGAREGAFRRRVPPDSDRTDDADQDERRVVDRRPVEARFEEHGFRGERKRPDDRVEHDPHDRDAVDPLVLLAQRPGAGLEAVAHAPAQER